MEYMPFNTFIDTQKASNPKATDEQIASLYKQTHGRGATERDFQTWADDTRKVNPGVDIPEEALRSRFTQRFGELDDDSPSDFMRGLKDTGNELLATGAGLAGLLGDSLGSKGLRDWGFKHYNEQMQDVRDNHRPEYEYDYLSKHGSFGDWVDAAQYYTTKGVGNLATGLGVGSAAKMGAQKAVKGLVRNASEKAVNKAGTAGFYGGLGAQAVGQELGSTYGEAANHQGVDNVDKSKVWGYGTLAGATEFAGDVALLGLGRLAPGLSIGTKLANPYARVGAQAAKGMGIQGGTERGQHYLETLGAGKPTEGDAYDAAARQAWFAGAMSGTALGGGMQGVQEAGSQYSQFLQNQQAAQQRDHAFRYGPSNYDLTSARESANREAANYGPTAQDARNQRSASYGPTAQDFAFGYGPPTPNAPDHARAYGLQQDRLGDWEGELAEQQAQQEWLNQLRQHTSRYAGLEQQDRQRREEYVKQQVPMISHLQSIPYFQEYQANRGLQDRAAPVPQSIPLGIPQGPIPPHLQDIPYLQELQRGLTPPARGLTPPPPHNLDTYSPEPRAPSEAVLPPKLARVQDLPPELFSHLGLTPPISGTEPATRFGLPEANKPLGDSPLDAGLDHYPSTWESVPTDKYDLLHPKKAWSSSKDALTNKLSGFFDSPEFNTYLSGRLGGDYSFASTYVPFNKFDGTPNPDMTRQMADIERKVNQGLDKGMSPHDLGIMDDVSTPDTHWKSYYVKYLEGKYNKNKPPEANTAPPIDLLPPSTSNSNAPQQVFKPEDIAATWAKDRSTLKHAGFFNSPFFTEPTDKTGKPIPFITRSGAVNRSIRDEMSRIKRLFDKGLPIKYSKHVWAQDYLAYLEDQKVNEASIVPPGVPPVQPPPGVPPVQPPPGVPPVQPPPGVPPVQPPPSGQEDAPKKKDRWTPEVLREYASSAATKALNLVSYTTDIAKRVSPMLPSALDFTQAYSANNADYLNKRKAAEDIYNLGRSLDKEQQAKISLFLAKSRKAGKWGYEPDWTPFHKPTVDEALKAEFNSFTPEMQGVIKDINRTAHTTLQERRELGNSTLTAAHTREIEAAKTANMSIEDLQKLMDEHKQELDSYDNSYREIVGPYAPFRRNGDYVTVYKSPELLQAEKEGDTAKVKTLKSSEKDYHMSFHESRKKAIEAREALRAKFGIGAGNNENLYYSEKSELLKQGYADTRVYGRLKSEIENTMFDSESRDKLSRLVDTMMLTSLREDHARKSEMKSLNVAGYDDMLDAFMQQASSDAHLLTNLKNSSDISAKLRKLQEEANTYDPNYSRNKKQEAFNELYKRYSGQLDYEETPIQDKIAALTSGYYLTTSPAYYLQSGLQTAMMTQPYLGAKHGYFRSGGALYEAYKKVWPMITSTKLFETFDTDKSMAPEHKAVLDELKKRGLLEITNESDMGRSDTFYDRTLRRLPGKMEVINRVVSALAAHDLAVKDGVPNPEQYAADAVYNTQGSFTGFEAPRLLNMLPASKVTGQFKKFPLLQAATLVKAANAIAEAHGPREKWAASKWLRYILANQAATTGIVGLPAVGAISALGKALDDKDEPEDLELKLRQALKAMNLPQSAIDAVVTGVPSALFDAPMTNKIGMQGVFDPAPFANYRDASEPGGFSDVVTKLAGPGVAMAGRMLEGAGRIAKGDVVRGAEKILPKGISDVVKAGRLATQGETSYTGDQVLRKEDLDSGDIILQALGIPSTTQTKRWFIQNQKVAHEKYFQEQTTELKHQFADARESGKPVEEIKQRWRRLQQAKRAKGFKPASMRDLLVAARDKRKREANVIGGVPYKPGNRQFVEEMSKL